MNTTKYQFITGRVFESYLMTLYDLTEGNNCLILISHQCIFWTLFSTSACQISRIMLTTVKVQNRGFQISRLQTPSTILNFPAPLSSPHPFILSWHNRIAQNFNIGYHYLHSVYPIRYLCCQSDTKMSFTEASL